MAVFNLKNYADKDGLGFPLNFRRGNPNPLDNSSVWASLEAAKNYAKTDPVAYVGQVLTVVDEAAKTATVYSIQNEDGDLLKVGSSPVGDESTITVHENGTISLYGVEGLDLTRIEGDDVVTDITYQPLLVKGKLTWVEPSATTVEGLSAEIEGLKSRVGAVEGNYLTSTDKTDIASAIEEAKREAVDAAVNKVLGETVDADFDTLQEVAEWIKSDTSSSTELIARVSAIEVDYLKGEDKSELQTSVSELKTFVGEIPEGAASDNVIAYISEMVSALSIGDYAKASELNALAERVSAAETKLSTTEEKLDKKVDAIDGKGLSTNDLTDELVSKINSITAGAQENVLEGVRVNGTEIVIEDKFVDIPIAGEELGVVKSSADVNKVSVGADGTMSINSISLDKVVQGDEEFVLNGGGATI